MQQSPPSNAATGAITVADGTLLNYEAATSHAITVRVTDQGGLTFDKSFSIALTNVNEVPTNIMLTGGSVAENAANGAAVGSVAAADPDAGATFTYSLTGNAGGRFAINAATGAITVANGGAALNYEDTPVHTISVRATDQGGLTFDKAFNIALTNVNEAPVNTVPGTQNVQANTWTLVSGVSIMDPDNTGSLITSVSVGHGEIWFNPNAGASVSNNNTGTVTLIGTVSQINATLGSLSYRGAQDWFDGDNIWVTTNDLGNGGAGGSLLDSDYIPVNFLYNSVSTSGNDWAWATYGVNQRLNGLGGSDRLVIPFALTQASISWSNSHVIISGPGGSRYIVNGFETYDFTDGTVKNDDGGWLIDDLFYYARNHDVWNAHVDADWYYNVTGRSEGRDPNAIDLAADGANGPDGVVAQTREIVFTEWGPPA